MHAAKLATLPIFAPARQGFAWVRARDERGWLLESADLAESFVARRAASCLLEPAIGDRVHFVAEGAEVFVIAVLERADPSAEALLQVEGDLALATDGRLRVSGRAGVELHSEAGLALRSDDLDVRARTGKLVFEQLVAVLRELVGHLRKSSVVAGVVESIVDRFSQQTKTSYRAVSEVDHVRAGTIDYRAEGAAHVHAQNTLMSAQELVKVDAGQIHLG